MQKNAVPNPVYSHWQPLSFFSAKLSPTQQRYSTFDRELQAAYSAVLHFRSYLEGRPFILLTDHKPLVAAFHRLSPPKSARQQRQLAFLSEFPLTIQHTSGISNVVADALSRPPSSSSHSICPLLPPLPATSTPPFSPLHLAQQQAVCPQTQQLLHSSTLQHAQHPLGDIFLHGDISTGHFRPLIPHSLRESVFHHIHDLAHPGIRATRRLLSSRYVWPHLSRDVTTWCRSCIACQTAKVHRDTQIPPQHIPVPDQCFSHLHIDLVGPLSPSSGFTYLLTVIDRTSPWPEAIPLASTAAADCASALIHTWISRFGVPSVITSDRGPQFTSSLWFHLCHLLNITHQPTTAYHPQSNGLVERLHRRLKDALRARAATTDWFYHLPWILLSFRTTPTEDSNISPAQIVYGTDLILPSQLSTDPLHAFSPLPPTLFSPFHFFPSSPAQHHVSSPPPPPLSIPLSLQTASHVFIRRDAAAPPLAPRYSGPFQVLSRSPTHFTLQIGSRQDVVSVHRLKPAILPPNTPPPQPPLRGCLPKRPPSILRSPQSPPPRKKDQFRGTPGSPTVHHPSPTTDVLPGRPQRHR